jgi:hypothetical protein
MTKQVIGIMITMLLMTGCASRSQIKEENPIKGISNLYNRNFIVAAPTYVGNLICGVPFFFLSAGIDTVYPGKKSETYFNVINNIYFIPSSICGVATGSLFIPFSYACEESPWDFDFQTSRNQSFDCHKKTSSF